MKGWLSASVCLVCGFGLMIPSQTVIALSNSSSKTKNHINRPVSLNIGWGDGKNIVVPLQVSHVRNLDETDVEADQAINVQVGKLNRIETLVLTVPLDKIALPQKVKVVDLRTGASVVFVARLLGKNVYKVTSVQLNGKIVRMPRRMRLNAGLLEEYKNGGKLEVSYVPPPAGSYWVMTKEHKVIPAKRSK